MLWSVPCYLGNMEKNNIALGCHFYAGRTPGAHAVTAVNAYWRGGLLLERWGSTAGRKMPSICIH